MKKLVIGIAAALVLLVPSIAGAHLLSGSLNAWITDSGTPSFRMDVFGHGTYQGHAHATMCLDVMLQEKITKATWIDVGSPAQNCSTSSSDTNLATISQDNCLTGSGDPDTYRVRLRFRTWGPNGVLSTDETRFKGQSKVSSDCMF
jgi:hypothetical protein